AKRIDSALEEPDARDRDPALAVRALDRDDHLRMSAVGRRRDWHRVEALLPASYALCGRMADEARCGNARDLLGGGIPEPDNARPIGEDDAVRHVREDTPGIGPFLDFAVETCAIDCDADPACEILRQRDLAGAVCGRRRNAATRQHAYSSSPTPDRDGDERNGLGREPGARLLVALQRRHQELLAGLHDLADVVPGLSGRVCRPPTGGSRRAEPLAVVLDRVQGPPAGA